MAKLQLRLCFVTVQLIPIVVRSASVAAAAAYPGRVGALVERWQMTSSSSKFHTFACAVVDNIHCAVIYIPSYFIGVGMLQVKICSVS